MQQQEVEKGDPSLHGSFSAAAVATALLPLSLLVLPLSLDRGTLRSVPGGGREKAKVFQGPLEGRGRVAKGKRGAR